MRLWYRSTDGRRNIYYSAFNIEALVSISSGNVALHCRSNSWEVRGFLLPRSLMRPLYHLYGESRKSLDLLMEGMNGLLIPTTACYS